MIRALAPRILWIDSLGALAVGLPMLLLPHTLTGWYQLPFPIVVAVAFANVAYGTASFTLALTPRWRVPSLLRALAAANMVWGVVCGALFVRYGAPASLFGAGHLVLEGVYVASLGVLEWWLVPLVAATARDEGPQWSLLGCRVPPPVVALVAASAMAALHHEWPSVRWMPQRVAGAALASGGIALALWAILAFRRAATTIHPLHPHQASTLIVVGPNRWTRNPMYLGLLTVLIGWGLWLGTAWSLLVVPLAWGWLWRFQVQPEERALVARFGTSYLDYARAVRRWV
ncbi:MAG: isoprenylcysteine carboxylmethyltransferase family protein [Gemmatimonadaceae bacterium]|nr:isoprenylcysteine carboxylmethyltransferase family protein [Gemmatimonadaceae bacterium]